MRFLPILPCLVFACRAAETDSAPLNETNKWAYSASVYNYFVPEGRSYAQPTVTMDGRDVHLEARFNYEALDTGSVWLGYSYSGGEKLTWEFTPMLGGAFGEIAGLAPGYKGSLNWWKLALYSEGEYFIDAENASGRFFYNWSELTLSPWPWFRFGTVAQRTRAYQSDRDIQRGLLVGFSYKVVAVSGYVFNPDDSKPTWVFAFTLSF